ncbi:hypothetical protein [Photobacterium minamisatsumaniensis]|uniref:hypothetical protein n=1 Tax=Photobacterium minamisatsumaniensis TaxID=2910233 RepID=UPI003D0E7FA5
MSQVLINTGKKKLTKSDFYDLANKKLGNYRNSQIAHSRCKLEIFLKAHSGKTFVADTELVSIGSACDLYFYKGFLIKYDGIYYYTLKIRNEIKYGALSYVKKHAEYESMKQNS